MEAPSSEIVTSNGFVDNRPNLKGRGSLAYKSVGDDGESVGDDGDASWKDECDQQRRGSALAVAATTTRAETANGMDKIIQAHAHTEGTSGVGLLELAERGGSYEYEHDAATTSPDGPTNGIHGGSGGRGGGGGLTAMASPPGLPAEREDIEVWGPGGLLATPNLKMILAIVCAVQAVTIGFEEAYPLWALSTPNVGGLGWDSMDIGQVLAVTGVIMAVFQLGVVPHIIKRVGIVNWQRAGTLLAIPVFLAVPNATSLSWSEGSLFAVSVLSNLIVNLCIQSIMLTLTIASTSMVPQHQRGKLGGIFMTAESLGRFLGPVSFSTTFAWSISTSIGWVDYHFVFAVSSIVFLIITALGWRTLALETLTKPAGCLGEGASGDSPRRAAASEDDVEHEV